MTIMAASLRSSSRRISSFLSSSYKQTSTSSGISSRSLFGYYNLRRFGISTSSTSTGAQDDDNTMSICKEDFEVGSRLVSFTTAMNDTKMDLSSYSRSKMEGHRVDFIAKGEVVMDIEKTKIVSVAEAGGSNGYVRYCYCFDQSTGKYYFGRGSSPPDIKGSIEEREFLKAQLDLHDAQQLKFPSNGLMKRPSLNDIIGSSIRRLFPGGCLSHVVYATTDVLESDGQQDPVIMAANNTSAALSVSGLLWGGPVGVVRVGRIRGSEDGAFVINPTMDQIIGEELDLNLVYACSRDKTLMVELEGCEVSERDVKAALRLAHHEAVKYIEPQIRLAERAGTNKKDHKSYMTTDYSRRNVENKVDTAMTRRMILEKGLRIDGRRLNQAREPQYCESGALPVHYGSSIFWLDCTQVLCLVKLRNSSYKDKNHSLDVDGDSYEWSPKFDITWKNLCSGAYRKAFLGVLPPEDDFPYHVGVHAEAMTNSDLADDYSTTYMASICGASLALMDAGIPLKRHVAGVSVGLVSDVNPSTGKGNLYLNLAGTRKGVTLIQLDIYNSITNETIGIPLDIICECIEPALKAHHQLLDHMEREIDAPRPTTCNFIRNGWNWPILDDGSCLSDDFKEEFFNKDYLRSLQLIDEPAAATDDQIITRDGRSISSTIDSKKNNQTVLETRKEILQAKLASRLRVGRKIQGVVFLIRKEDGVFIRFTKTIGFLPVSETMLHQEDDHGQKKISDWVSIGRRISATCVGYDTRGIFKLSMQSSVPVSK